MLLKHKELLCQKGYDFDAFQSKSVLERYNILYDLQEEYLGHNKPINHITPIVSVCIPTYQHHNYIRECIEGVLMQQTSFPFEIVIGDDGSVDGTTEICIEYAEKYPDKIRFYNRAREFCRVFDSEGHIERSGNWWWTLQEGRGKYIAVCEGDDYWINPLKLQKQVDFLERNSDFGMIFSRVYVQHDNGAVEKIEMGSDKVSFEQILCDNPIVMLTTCVRKSLLEDYYQDLEYCRNNGIHNMQWMMGDYPMWVYVAYKAKIYCMPEVTGVYRILQESASHSKNIYKEIAFIKSRMEISHFYAKRYGKEKLNCKINYVGMKHIAYKLLKSNRIEDLKKEMNAFSPIDYRLFFLKRLVNFSIGRWLLCKKWHI